MFKYCLDHLIQHSLLILLLTKQAAEKGHMALGDKVKSGGAGAGRRCGPGEFPQSGERGRKCGPVRGGETGEKCHTGS